MASKVFYGSPRQARWDAKETLPAKLDLIIDQLHIRERVKDEIVALKMHLGNNLSYSTIHPVFLRKVIQAVKDGGGKPYIIDVEWDVAASEARGYSQETLGCPVYPMAGPTNRYVYKHHKPYKGIQDWEVGGFVEDATFLINFAHAKGHPSCSYGGAFKNLALGCMSGRTRGQMHDTMHYDPYWFPEKCTDKETLKRIMEVCPFEAIVEDKENPGNLHLHFEQCNQCGRCLQVAPAGSLKIDPVNFHSFQEACAISTSVSLSTFEPGKVTNLVLATMVTPLCDCFGFTGMSILPDVGIFGSDDIVAIDQAVLDKLAEHAIIEENVPTGMEINSREGHPLSWLHGQMKDPYKVVEYAEGLGLGSRDYELVDVLPVEKIERMSMDYIPAK